MTCLLSPQLSAQNTVYPRFFLLVSKVVRPMHDGFPMKIWKSLAEHIP